MGINESKLVDLVVGVNGSFWLVNFKIRILLMMKVLGGGRWV